MLRIFNNLKPFFEDCYKEVNVREYARVLRISPPTASKLAGYYSGQGLLKKRVFRNNLLFRANRESDLFIRLSTAYWSLKFKDLLDYINSSLVSPQIILFGSLSKAETTDKSDIDLAIISIAKKELDLVKYEKALKRKIQLFIFSSFGDIKNLDLKSNILNGVVLSGPLRLEG